MADKWMQGVHPKKGALHRELSIPAKDKIPTSTLREREGMKGKAGLRVRLALRYRGL